jgi:hypothetical protein
MKNGGLSMFYTSEPDALRSALSARREGGVIEAGEASRILKFPQVAEIAPRNGKSGKAGKTTLGPRVSASA